MDASTKEDWLRIAVATVERQSDVAGSIMSMLRRLEGFYAGFQVDQLHHALQTATMAMRANASDEMVLVALCHDIGKTVSIANHGAIAAEMLKPYVSRESYCILRTHQDFQGRHYYKHFNKSSTMRDVYKAEPWFAMAETFTDEWDQVAFDPAYKVQPLEDFEPLVQKFFGRFYVPQGGCIT